MFYQDPDFNQLKKLWTLKLVVELGGLKRTATRCKVSLSAISQTISGLERQLGRKLLVRQDRRLIPTQYCRDLLAKIEPGFNIFSQLGIGPVCELQVPKMKWLDFGVCESLAPTFIPGLTRSLKSKLPNLRLTFRVARSQQLARLVSHGELCMALLEEDEIPSGISRFPIYEDRLGLFISIEHRSELEIAKKLGIATLLPESHGHPLHYGRFLRKIAPQLRPALSSDNLQTLLEVAASGVMAAVLPVSQAKRLNNLREVGISKSGPDQKLGRYTISMVSQRGCDPVEVAFLVQEIRMLAIPLEATIQ